MNKTYTIIELLQAGKTWAEIQKLTGKSRSTVAYHARHLRKGIVVIESKKYDWSSISVYAQKHTVDECCQKFGFARSTWSLAVQRGVIKARDAKLPLSEVAVQGSSYTRACMRKRVIRDKLLPYKCDACGNDGVWQDKKLSLQLHHVNGRNDDNRLENLKLLCPNCHSQTNNFSGKKRKKKCLSKIT